MTTRNMGIHGAKVITLEPLVDERGYFVEVLGKSLPFVPQQVSQSCSKKGTIRGLHIQFGPKMEKIVRCIRGMALLYVVDVRDPARPVKDEIILRGEYTMSVLVHVPEHCAIGYEALENDTIIEYFHSAPYNQETSVAIRYDDPTIGIIWPSSFSHNKIISKRDQEAMSYTDWVELSTRLKLFPLDK